MFLFLYVSVIMFILYYIYMPHKMCIRDRTYAEQYNPALSGEIKVPVDSIPPMALSLIHI